MSDHAFLPPSGADCWVACHKWPWMQREFPDLGDKTAADEGTLAAQALNCLATGQPMPAGVTDEMAGHVADTWMYALGLGVTEWNSEQKLHGKSIHDSQNYGTPDLYGWDTFNLHVIDLKYGHGFVNHVGNWQCINYVSLILDQLNMSHELELKITVHIHIAQPRCFTAEPFRCWTIPLIDLRAYFNTLRNAAGTAAPGQGVGQLGPAQGQGFQNATLSAPFRPRIARASAGVATERPNPSTMPRIWRTCWALLCARTPLAA